LRATLNVRSSPDCRHREAHRNPSERAKNCREQAKQKSGLFDHLRFAHRSADMPIWGCRHREGSMAKGSAKLSGTRKHDRWRFNARSEQHELESLLHATQKQVIQERILSIVGYLSLIQEK